MWWLLVLLVAGFMWYSFVQQIIFDKPFGSNPAPDALLIGLWVVFGIVFPILMLAVTKLIVEVREDGLYIRFMPLHRRYRAFLYKDIVHYEVISYSPLKRFGGWGIRMNAQGETAYNMNGDRGLELKLSNQTVVIGSRQPEALKKAVDAIGPRTPVPNTLLSSRSISPD